MRTFSVITLLFLSGTILAQTPQREINEQVWKPFISSYNDLQLDSFMALHSRELVRTVRDDGRVMGYEEYKVVKSSGNHNTLVNHFQKKLELRFLERWVNKDLAFDVGIFKSTTLKPSGNNIITYGKFHVALRKENGVWKILTDADSTEGGTISDRDFLSARPLE